MGDAVIELFVREHLLVDGDTTGSKATENSRDYVTAEKQSEAVENILPLLNEIELSVYKRGRNSKSVHMPKHASPTDYRRATGFESLFGYLYLNQEIDRARYLFQTAYEIK
jgi:ribonuclease-3 family protein